jgi:sporulation factor SpoIVFB. Metallo peptidase. MEROPS family M50B
MKSILGWSDWCVHPFTLLYIMAAYINDYVIEYLMALGIVCFHEMFHYIFAKLYDFEIDCVEVLPFGAFLSLQDYGLHHIVEELVTILAGLCSHFFIYFMILYLGANPYLLAVNRLVFLFNILPVYPLDGSKIILLLLSTCMDYQKAIKLQIKISILALSILIIMKPQVSHFVVYGYLIYLNYQYIKEYRVYLVRLYTTRRQKAKYRRFKLHDRFVFYRPYQNMYQINNAVYHEEEVMPELIKTIKNN